MLPKPVTAFALSAFVSIASFTAPAVAASGTSPGSATSASSSASQKTVHHPKKKGVSKAPKKSAHLALHSAEPKESPRLPAKESPKDSARVPASLSTHLDLKNAQDKGPHGAASKRTTLAATGKEIYLGGPTAHAGGAAEKHDRVAVDGHAHAGQLSGKIALNGAVHSAKGGAMAKAARAPSRPDGARKLDVVDPASDDHPVQVALRGPAKPALAVVASTPCMHDAIEFVRGPETDRFPVTQCDGGAAPLAAERLSVLVRPETAAHPPSVGELAKVKGPELAPGVRRIDPGLLSRIQLIADHFAKPGMPERIAIVSGYRPGSTGSFHAAAQALDFHLEGVPNEALVDFCKTLENTGCGYYPNSSFVHVDVRAPGTGHVAWIDTSGPGEPPHYVASWPPPPDAAVQLAAEEADMVNPYTKELPPLPGEARETDSHRAPAASVNVPFRLKDFE